MNVFLPPDWRFIPVSGKSPIWPDWTNKGVEWKSLPAEYGAGLVLGPASGGTVAIDFDGQEAWDFFEGNFPGNTSLDCPIWASGKPRRMQVAFRVPQEHWSALKTIKVGVGKKLEFRWAGSQSVIPPSPHPDGGTYGWVTEPTALNTQSQIPQNILDFWLGHCAGKAAIAPLPLLAPSISLNGHEKVRDLLTILQRAGRPAYDDWRDITWAVVREIGLQDAESLMRDFFPETQTGEYRKLLRDFNLSRAPGMGSLVLRAKAIDAEETMKIQKKYYCGSGPSARSEYETLRLGRLIGKR